MSEIALAFCQQFSTPVPIILPDEADKLGHHQLIVSYRKIQIFNLQQGLMLSTQQNGLISYQSHNYYLELILPSITPSEHPVVLSFFRYKFLFL